MIRYHTAGESHGKQVTVILEGIPAGLKITPDYINVQLERRQIGYGRGKRMDIEKDRVEIISGIRWGGTIGSPIGMVIKNKDWENHMKIMSINEADMDQSLYLTRPRPGHADLAGAIKYNRKDIRDILERASARETAARVAGGAVARKLLEEFEIYVASFISKIGTIQAEETDLSVKKIFDLDEKSPLRCVDKDAEQKMIQEIDKVSKDGDTLGGVFTVLVDGVPPGLGSHTQWDLKLDGRVAQSLMSIQGIKGVEVGAGFNAAAKRGSQVHDEIMYDSDKKKFYRTSNNGGGIEGGMTNGERLIFRAAMKPISSLQKPLKSVDINTKKAAASEVVRADVCAVPAAGVVAEAVVAIEIARALKEKFGGDSLEEMVRNYKNYLKQVEGF